MDRKKMAAASAAVMTYIKTQEEAACFASSLDQTSGSASELLTPLPAACINTWGMAGRNDQMQSRSLMQMGIFK
ncbi:hypothetical protein SAMN02746065_12735 [Desulfocicer vacuolatum DSM 3385]|uniref:Uncharacterized protein n=1 Tax=Desulfocicer vacuolatum DSM 3385 TaxID=1121400 RepID=A0A1W2EAA7_9BACT|nr:hypothetical protein [Desulfocicer vacuolatum]SMD06487.1 hypothetical protein SAMN02746065_12735 [Desulfocicer vacuolatum DSM 3385]